MKKLKKSKNQKKCKVMKNNFFKKTLKTKGQKNGVKKSFEKANI